MHLESELLGIGSEQVLRQEFPLEANILVMKTWKENHNLQL